MRTMIHVYVQADDQFHLTIVNMKKSDSLYNYGLKPLVCRSQMDMHYGIDRRACTVIFSVCMDLSLSLPSSVHPSLPL